MHTIRLNDTELKDISGGKRKKYRHKKAQTTAQVAARGSAGVTIVI